MLQILQFTLESFGHFCGVCFLISLTGFWSLAVAMQIGKIGRPRKHVKTTYSNTHKLQ